TLRAIPLTAGKHHFILEYVPWQFTAGKWITILATITLLGACVFVVARSRKAIASATIAFFAVVVPHASAAPPVSTRPVQIVETSLENPRNADAKSLVDLDTGKTFTFGEYASKDFRSSR